MPDEFIPWLVKRKQSNPIIYRLTQEADGFNENSPMNEYWDPDKSYDDNKYIRVAIHLITCPYHLRLSQNKQTFHLISSYFAIDAELIIVDEISMIGVQLFAYFLGAVKNGSIVILVGDEDQLLSVESGNVLHDLIASQKIEVCRLTEVMRQSGIICSNATAINAGLIDQVITDKTFVVNNYSSVEDAIQGLEDVFIFDEGTILCPVKNYKTGTGMLNKLRQDPKKKVLASYGKKDFKLGDPIIMTKTDYEKGYINGDMGTVIGCTKDEELIVDINGLTYMMSRLDMSNIDLAYAITIHKSQGSEFDTVHIFLPDGADSLTTRRLLYTAVTRAKRIVYIYNVNKSMEKAMRISDVPCYVIGGNDMDVVSQRLIIELSNLETREFNRDDHRFQVLQLLKVMSESGTISQKKIVKNVSKQLGVSPRYSRMYFTVFNKGSEKVLDAVKKSEMPLHIASNISNLPKEDQDTLLENTELMDSVKRREISAKDASNIANRPDNEKNLMVDAVKKGADAKKVIETMDVFKEKKKKPIQLDTDQDYEFYQALNDMKENDDYDIDDDDDIESAMDFLTRNSEHIPLNVDTSGLHNELSQEDEEKNAAVAVRKAIRTIKKLKRKTEFTDEEEELFDVMREVLNYKDSLQ